MADVIDVLAAIKESERSTAAMMREFPEWVERQDASKFLGNMFKNGLIQKRSNGYWALTDKGRRRLESVSDLGKVEAKTAPGPEITQPINQAMRDMSQPVESGPADPAKAIGCEIKPDRSMSPWDMARRLQLEIPNGSSLVIEADEVFLAWRGARFAIQTPEDLQAFRAIQDAYIGEVA